MREFLASKQASKQAERIISRSLSFAYRNLDNNSVSEEIQGLSFYIGSIAAKAWDRVAEYIDNLIGRTNFDIKDRLEAVA